MIYLESAVTDPYFNLALEEYVFQTMDRNKSYFMLWQNENTIVVGKYQNTMEEINQKFVEDNRIRVVRRLSGGGAVYHDHGNLNFTFIVDEKSAENFNFSVFVLPVIETLKQFGIDACFNGRNDITINGKKFSGNSQYAKGGRILHHGCIMLNSNLTNVSDALRVNSSKFASKSEKSVHSRVTSINRCAPQAITMEEFKKALKTCVMKNGNLEEHTLTEEDIAAIEKLRDEKYATWEWNYGKSPSCTVKREQKFPSGLVTAYLCVNSGKIDSVNFFGDFFGNGELNELESSLEGLFLDENLLERLEQLNLDYYIHGITAQDLYQLLMYG